MMLLVGAVVAVLAAGAGVGQAADTGRSWAPTSPAVTAGGTIGSGAAGALDTRLQRDIEAGKGQRCSRHDALSGDPVIGQRQRVALGALAAVLERAGHPERIGRILLRGPPAPSV
jgi:hypothetical protein